MPNFLFIPKVGTTYTYDGSGTAHEGHRLTGKRLTCISADAVEETLIGAEFEVEGTGERVHLSSDEIFWGIRFRKHPQPGNQSEPQTEKPSAQIQ